MIFAEQERDIITLTDDMGAYVSAMWDRYPPDVIAASLSTHYGFGISPRWVCSAKQRLDGRARPGLQMKGSGDADHIPLRDRSPSE